MLISGFPDRSLFSELSNSYSVIPCFRTVLYDLESPVSVLGKIKEQEGIFLLESVEGGERWGRYSFLGISPYAHVTVFSNRVEIDFTDRKPREIYHHDGNPLGILRKIMSRYVAPSVQGLPRFWGGLVGYMCYEMASFFEPIPNLLPQENPLARFVIPRDTMIFDHRNHTVTLLSIAYQESPCTFDEVQRRLDKLEELLNAPKPDIILFNWQSHNEILLQPAVSPDDFEDMVRKAKEYIRDGEAIQIVLSQPFRASCNLDPWALYRIQRYINPSPYLFFCKLGTLTLVGSSPETMVRLENGIVSLRPIAGTRPRGFTEQEDRKRANELLKDEKERAEHIMLVDLGRNDLGRVAEVGSVQVTEYMTIERYSHVMHLVSHVQAHLRKGLDAWDVIRATFPAGTLTGAPKVRAMQIIAELERRPRGPYGGCVGYVSFQGNLDMAITIRTAVVEDGTVAVQAGAGIVADSDPHRERLETLHKAKAMEQAIKMLTGRKG